MSRKISIAVAFFLLSTIFGQFNYDASAEDEIPEWGFYVYMAGDNTLYDELTDDLNEMKMVGSSDELDIVALTDKINDNDSHLYHIQKHNLVETNLSEVNNTWERELDMGDGDTLRDFLIWASDNFPAKRKILVIWNHGSGWEKVAEDGYSYLTVPEIKKSLNEYREVTNQSPFTLIGFDACLMGMFEIMHELKEHANMIHGSEAYEPLEGWTYNNLLYKLKRNLSDEELAYHVVNDYVESYRNGSVYTSYSVTASVVSTNNLESLWNELDNFSSELNSALPIFKDEINNARDNTQRFDQNPNYRDLYDLTIQVEQNLPLVSVKEVARNLREEINRTVIFEDHWIKPGKLNVERAKGMTIYFPTEGVKSGYGNLGINQSKWFDFISNYETPVQPKSNFEIVNTKGTDTGTGHNDSVHISATFEGEASKLILNMLNPDGELIETIVQNVEGNSIVNITVQPNKSGNYSIELTLYSDNGLLQDYYYEENIYIDLNLPDLHLDIPELISETSKGIFTQVKGVDTNDNFFVRGQIRNLGSIGANNISLKIEYEDREKILNYTKLGYNEIVNWTLTGSEILNYGNFSRNVVVNLSVSSTDYYEIDSQNNVSTFSFFIFGNEPHSYNAVVKNLNTVELERNENGYYFPWLETEITITDSSEQSWDLVNFNFDLPDFWEINKTSILQTEAEGKIVIGLKPPIGTKKGESIIPFEIIDRNGVIGGYGTVRVTIPQYYGVSIAAQQSDSNVKILVTNTGNGKDTFKLSKQLEDGLTLYLTETYFELEAEEIKEINTQGLSTETTSNYEAYFEIESIGNDNISASIVLDIKGTDTSKLEESSGPNIILFTVIGAVIISIYIIRSRMS